MRTRKTPNRDTFDAVTIYHAFKDPSSTVSLTIFYVTRGNDLQFLLFLLFCRAFRCLWSIAVMSLNRKEKKQREYTGKELIRLNKAKGHISRRRKQRNKACQVFRKTNISYPLIHPRTCSYQALRMFVFR